jgi:hypothetical protein
MRQRQQQQRPQPLRTNPRKSTGSIPLRSWSRHHGKQIDQNARFLGSGRRTMQMDVRQPRGEPVLNCQLAFFNHFLEQYTIASWINWRSWQLQTIREHVYHAISATYTVCAW